MGYWDPPFQGLHVVNIFKYIKSNVIKTLLFSYLNLPDTSYTSGRLLHGVRVEMTKRKMKKKKKSSREGGDCKNPQHMPI